MSYKIAFASSDGKMVNQKFHNADRFVIYEVFDEKNWKFLDTRKFSDKLSEQNILVESNLAKTSCVKLDALKKIPQCGSGLGCSSFFSPKVSLVEDCRGLVCSKIGLKAQKEFLRRDISVFEIDIDIPTALAKLSGYFSHIDSHENFMKKKV